MAARDCRETASASALCFRAVRWAVLTLALVMALAGVKLLAPAGPTLAHHVNVPYSLVTNFHAPSNTSGQLHTGELFGQGFTTGPERYSLDGVSLDLATVNAGAELVATIHRTEPDGVPAFPALYTLTAPSPLDGNAINHFSAPAGAVLEPKTDYVVVMGTSGASVVIKATTRTTEQAGKAPDWSISNESLSRKAGTGTWLRDNFPRKIDVVGAITAYTPPGKVEGLSVSAVGATLRASWDPVPLASEYLVEWKSGAETFAADRGKRISSAANTAGVIDGLTKGTEHTVRVTATRRYGTVKGPPSDEKTATTLLLELERLVTNHDRAGRQSVLSPNQPRAQGFYTGPDLYALRNIGLCLSAVDNGETLAVAIHEQDPSGAFYPAREALYQLTPPPNLVSDACNIFEAPADADLDGRAQYYVVFEAMGGTLNFQHTSDPGQKGALGWSISDGHQRRVQSGWVNASFAASMYVMGTTWYYSDPSKVVSPPTVTPVPGGLTLRWSPVQFADGYRLQWKSGVETFDTAAADGREEILRIEVIRANSAALHEAVEHTVYGLSSDVEHTVRVIPFRHPYGEAIVTGEASDEARGTPLPPPPRIEVNGRFLMQVDSLDRICSVTNSAGVCGNNVTVYPQYDYDVNYSEEIFVAGIDWAPMGLWSDGATMWVGDHLHSSVHALDLGQLRHGVVRIDQDRSFEDELLNAAGTRHPGVVWGDADTLWVFDVFSGYFHAYDRATKTRIPDKSFPTRLDNGQSVVVWGVWSDGTTMWISGPTTSIQRPDGGDHWPTLGGVFTVDLASGYIEKARGYEDVRGSHGLWSDGVTMWVVSAGDEKLKAYGLRSGSRDADRDIGIGRIVEPGGVWSDGEVIWVSDLDRRIMSYCLTDPCGAGNVSEPPRADFAGDRTTAGRMEVGGTVTGKITSVADVDWYAIYLDAGGYRFALQGTNVGGGGSWRTAAGSRAPAA